MGRSKGSGNDTINDFLQEETSMFCPNCGKEIPDNSAFCPECGTNLREAYTNHAGTGAAPNSGQANQTVDYRNQTTNSTQAGSAYTQNQGDGYSKANTNGYNQADGYTDPNANGYNNQNQFTSPQPYGGNAGGYPSGRGTNRSIALCIILSLVTCGIYGLYWMVKMNDEINLLADEPGATSGGMVVLLAIVTCNIYTWYWCYKMGERCDRIKSKWGEASSSSVIYLILAIFGLDIVAYALMQDTINKAVDMGL